MFSVASDVLTDAGRTSTTGVLNTSAPAFGEFKVIGVVTRSSTSPSVNAGGDWAGNVTEGVATTDDGGVTFPLDVSPIDDGGRTDFFGGERTDGGVGAVGDVSRDGTSGLAVGVPTPSDVV